MRRSEIDKLGFEGGRITGFEPRFRSIDEDWDRYTEALVELHRRGAVPGKKNHSLHDLYCSDLTEWLTDRYFEAGLLDHIEAHYTPAGEVPFGPIYEGHLKVLDRLTRMGEAARVRRIWRAHTGLLKGVYWWYAGQKKAGYRTSKNDLRPERVQRQEYEELIGKIPDMKKRLLEVMSDHLDVARSNGASNAEVARIRSDMAAVEAEDRPRPWGKPDPRKIDEDLFWELISDGLETLPLAERLDTLPERLAGFKATAIRSFKKILHTLDARAYRTDIWALAYLLQGGCSDDAFDQFRGWLILQGREVFEATLADPDGFDTRRHTGAAGGMDALRDVAPMAYEMRQGKAMPPVTVPPLSLSGPDLSEEEFATALPGIALAVEWGT